jgi:hypothetical protein
MVKCGVLFEVRTEFLNNIYYPQTTSWSLRGVDDLSAVGGGGKYKACRWTEDFHLISDKET